MQKIIEVQKSIGYEFFNKELLVLALTHRSFGIDNNERLEFLGDSVLNTVISNYLFFKFPDASEGELSRMRANLVDRMSLIKIGKRLNLAAFIRMDKNQKAQTQKQKKANPSALSDAVESIFGAVFIDGGLDAVTKVILLVYRPLLNSKSLNALACPSSKTSLQEFLQKNKSKLPEYSLIKTAGPDHNLEFFVLCKIYLNIEGKKLLKIEKVASGNSMKQAEQNAAELILVHLVEKSIKVSNK